MEKNKDKSHLIDQLYDYLEEQIQELKTDRNQLNHKMQDMIQEKNEKEEKITKLHDYQKGLEETCLFAEEFVEREDQKILFVPAFEQLMGYVKKLYPTQRINYQDSSESSKVCMTFSFLKGFQAVLESLLNEIGVFVLNFEMNIEEYKILINIEAKPKVIKNAKDFYEKRSVLENKLTKEFSIERWKTNAVVIQTMIEM